MALQIEITLDTGISIPKGYCKIKNYSGGREYLSYTVETFANQQARIDEKKTVKQDDRFTIKLSDLIYDPTQTTFEFAIFTALYQNLKTQDGFAGGIDV